MRLHRGISQGGGMGNQGGVFKQKANYKCARIKKDKLEIIMDQQKVRSI